MDEWGVWEIPSGSVDFQLKSKPWQTAPAIREQIYTIEDSLLFASMLMVLLKNADRVKIACQSLLTKYQCVHYDCSRRRSMGTTDLLPIRPFG